jgi:glycolate oxidase
MLTKALVREFKAQIGEDSVFSDPTDLITYSYDAAPLESVTPALVVRPATGEALSRAVRLCNQNRLPLTVRGAGTNLSGGTVPLAGGVVVVTNGLNRILEINSEDMYAVVEPGVSRPSSPRRPRPRACSTHRIPAARRSPLSAATWPKTPADCAG